MVGVLVVIVLVTTAFMIWWVRRMILASRPVTLADHPRPLIDPAPQPRET